MSFQIVYRIEEEHCIFTPEEKFMAASGIPVGKVADPESTSILYRGSYFRKAEDFPSDSRSIHSGETHINHLFLPRWYPFISDLTMETLFVNDLDEEAVLRIKEKGWDRAFVKDWIKSVAYPDLSDTVWPNSLMSEIKQRLAEGRRNVGYCLRKFVEPELLDNETRFWVMNGNIYSSIAEPFPIVREAVRRLKLLGGRMYTIDATPEVVIEINPGESSDRGAKNTIEDFAGWIKKEFCSN
jgi:hypothetical protein